MAFLKYFEQVSIFYECFSDEEVHTESEERNSIREMVQYYNRRFSGQHSSVSYFFKIIVVSKEEKEYGNFKFM